MSKVPSLCRKVNPFASSWRYTILVVRVRWMQKALVDIVLSWNYYAKRRFAFLSPPLVRYLSALSTIDILVTERGVRKLNYHCSGNDWY